MAALKAKRRWFLAGLISFVCVFSQTLIQTNALFALDGMINHTAVDWEPFKNHNKFRTNGSSSKKCVTVGFRH